MVGFYDLAATQVNSCKFGSDPTQVARLIYNGLIYGKMVDLKRRFRRDWALAQILSLANPTGELLLSTSQASLQASSARLGSIMLELKHLLLCHEPSSC